MRHEVIIPLIGGIALASERVFETPPSRIFSYPVFFQNDQHLLNYYKQRDIDVPYQLLDNNPEYKSEGPVDVVSTLCPCAGLSGLNKKASADSEHNDWMEKTANFVLGSIQPQVFWGENAPGFFGDIGDVIRTKLYNIGRLYGYTMLLYKTNSLKHGIPHKRPRTFYFFWKENNRVPLFDFIDKPYIPYEEYIKRATGNTLQFPVARGRTLSDNVFYRYIREVIRPESTHQSLQDELTKPWEIISYIQKHSTLNGLAHWLGKQGEQELSERYYQKSSKVLNGKHIFKRGGYLGKNYIHAISQRMPSLMIHPNEERYITFRETMTMMGLPQDFELHQPYKNIHHIGQNVPVDTAVDMANQIKKYVDKQLTMMYNTIMFQDNTKNDHDGNQSLLHHFD